MSEALTLPTGSPTDLAVSVDQYEQAELTIASAAAGLVSVVMGGGARSIEALDGKSSAASEHLGQAHARYQGTRAALRSYTVDLLDFHTAAGAAIERDHEARQALQAACSDLVDAAKNARIAAMNPQDQETIDYWQAQVRVARLQADAAHDEIAAAGAHYGGAAQAFEEAAQQAIARIDASFDGTNDGRWDRIAHAFSQIGSFLASLADWVGGAFKAAFESIAEAIATFVLALLLALTVIALIGLLVVVIVLAVALIINLLVGVLATLVALLGVGYVANDVATTLGVDDLARIRIVLAAVAVACPVLGYFLLVRIENELFKPAPKVALLDPASVDSHNAATTSGQAKALADLQAHLPDSVDDFLWQAGAVDTIGGSTQTVVDIAKIIHEDGTVAWIVTLPSTKDWVVPSDQGATNDLDADLLLIAFPELQSQYEKAALDAMAQAGIGRSEPVLVTGWSLGGVLAGHLVQTGAGGYTYGGVVAAGSPIDQLNISADIPVIQVKHTRDLVHRGDLIDSRADEGAHVSLWDGARSGIGMEVKTDTMGHSAFQYHQTLEQHVGANQSLNDDFREFFVVDDPNHTGKPTIEHAQYAFSE